MANRIYDWAVDALFPSNTLDFQLHAFELRMLKADAYNFDPTHIETVDGLSANDFIVTVPLTWQAVSPITNPASTAVPIVCDPVIIVGKTSIYQSDNAVVTINAGGPYGNRQRLLAYLDTSPDLSPTNPITWDGNDKVISGITINLTQP